MCLIYDGLKAERNAIRNVGVISFETETKMYEMLRQSAHRLMTSPHVSIGDRLCFRFRLASKGI